MGQTGPKWPAGVLLDLPLDLDDYRRPEHGIVIMDVGAWLRSLGLAQYEALFRQNDIDAEVLGDLTDADLEKLGLTLGHRKRLLKAIASLDGTEPVAKPTSPASPSLSTDAAERRPITVMFCDLVGSTNLAARLDAEDWRNLVGAYLDAASAAVTGLGGHVLKKLGDGLMALFGYPHAQENDAERAVRAALAIQRALADLNARNARSGAPELAARIGIECGSVVVDAAGEVFGEAPNVAARVQAAAEPGTVLVTASVQRQTTGLFVVEDKGAHDLKGVAAPVALYRIVRASGGGRRGGARALTPLVGREDELALLTRRWSRALAGEGQFVQIVGEPGIGKSRLIEEFRGKLADTPHTWVEWAASQLLQNTPLHPLAEWGRLRFGGADATDEGRLADLENTLRLIGLDAAEYAPLVAPLVDVPLPEDRRAKFPPEELRRRQLAAMTALFLAGARSQPVVLAFEDLHWADPTSLDLLRALVERGAQAPLLIVVTTRPEFRPDWSLRSHHSVISLAPLDRAQVRRMVGEIATRHALSDEVIDGVGERTGGVPLFVEEVTRLLLERNAQGGAQAIPPTLQQSLAARLDRLGEAREVAQIGAVLGRDFSYRLLSDVSSSAAGFDEPRLQAALDRLTEADLLFVDGAPPTAAYRFKHALIQDAAYESLLRSRRQALHRRAAEALRDANAEPEAIAHHFNESGLDDLAIEWWGKAGDQALRRSAFQEAIAHLGKAIAMADKAGATARRATDDSAAPTQRLTPLQVAYGNALIASRGLGAPETTEAFAKARELASGDKDAPERLAADYGLWGSSYVRGELPSMRAHAAAFLNDVEARPDSPEAGVAHRAAGSTCWFAGEYREARDHLERALALFQPGRDDDLAFRFGYDAGVGAMALLAIASWLLGEVDRAISLIDRMQTRMANLTLVGALATGRMYAAMFELMRGHNTRGATNAFEVARLAREHDLRMFRAFGVFFEGWATAATGAVGGGLEAMRRGVELLREQNVLLFDGLLKIALAEAEARAGDPGRAVAILDEALATCDRLGHRAFEAELQRARGEILLERDPAHPAPAEEVFLMRGELPSMRAHADAFLSDIETRPDSPEAGVAHRAVGMSCWFAGEYREARDHLERALALFQPGRDDDLAFRFGQDPGVAAMIYLAFASWTFGEVDRAVSLVERMKTRIAGLSHATTLALGACLAAFFALMRHDRPGARTSVSDLARVVREHDLPLWRAFGMFLEGCSTGWSGAAGSGLEDMRGGVELLREQNVLVFEGLLKIALAEAEARAGDPGRAIAILNEALATVARTGHRAFEAELHRVRGEILLKRDPTNPAPAEEAFLTAIAVAKQQATRSFELRAALALAKLYQSTARPLEAYSVLAQAVDGFEAIPLLRIARRMTDILPNALWREGPGMRAHPDQTTARKPAPPTPLRASTSSARGGEGHGLCRNAGNCGSAGASGGAGGDR